MRMYEMYRVHVGMGMRMGMGRIHAGIRMGIGKIHAGMRMRMG